MQYNSIFLSTYWTGFISLLLFLVLPFIYLFFKIILIGG